MQFTHTQKSAAAWCLIAALAVVALWSLGPVLTPFVVAAVLAYALTPLVNRLDGLGKGWLPRVLAVVLVELLFIVVLLGLFLLIVPIMAKELPLLREQVPLLADRLNTELAPCLKCPSAIRNPCWSAAPTAWAPSCAWPLSGICTTPWA